MAFDLLAQLGEDPAMVAIFGEDRVIDDWLTVEAEFAHALADSGLIEAAIADRIAAACTTEQIDRTKLWSEMRNVGYPILPLVEQICASLEPAEAAWVHYGATTQDIMDSALALELRDGAARLIDLTRAFGDRLASHVEEHATTVMPGRTHAQQAVPTTLGAKLAILLDQLGRDEVRLRRAAASAATVSLHGAGGTSAALGEHAAYVRDRLAARLGLATAPIPWHVARDRVTELGLAAAMVSGTCIRFAREVIDLSRTEVGEVSEVTGHHRGASSTMPQKSNPISCEAIIGFGVSAQASAQALLRALEAGHERAVGEWQIEWRVVPATMIATASALAIAADTAATMQVFPDRMLTNLDLDGGRLMAEASMIVLARHLGRDVAHEAVYAAVVRSRELNVPLIEALRDSLPPQIWEDIANVLPSPEDYLGETSSSSASALQAWRTTDRSD